MSLFLIRSVLAGPGAGLLLWGVVGSLPTLSPSPSPAHPVGGTVRHDSVPASAVIDTGDLAIGNRDFTHFTIPGLCVGAVHAAQDLARRSLAAQRGAVLRRDTAPELDSLPSSAVEVARSCSARFTLEGLRTERDLRDLFTLALLAGHDSLAQAVVDRFVTQARSDSARVAVLQAAVAGYLQAEPARVAAAHALTERIDTLGVRFVVAQLQAHVQLLAVAMQAFDVSLIRQEAERILTLGHGVTKTEDDGPLIQAYEALAQVAYVEAPDSVLPLMARAKADLQRFAPLMAAHGMGWPGADFRTLSASELRDRFLPFNAELLQARYAGKPLPPVTATYWRPAPPHAWPPGGMGRVSLVVYGGYLPNGCARNDDMLLGDPMGPNSFCTPLYTSLPQWVAQYGDRLSITLVAQTQGAAVRSLPLSPTAEADTLAWFFRTHLGLPVTVGVVEDSVWQLPAPDGRRFGFDTTFYGQFQGRPGLDGSEFRPVVLLYGADGTLLYVGNPEHSLLRRLLIRALDRSVATRQAAR